MNRIAIDIEANGLNELALDRKGEVINEANTIWCIAIVDVDTGEELSFGPDNIDGAVEVMRGADLIIGHNIIFYDMPVITRLYGDVSTPVYDTLVVSRLMYPDKRSHPLGGNSLRCWGDYLGFSKIDYDGGWDMYSEEMLTYCIKDTQIAAKIFHKQQPFVKHHAKIVKLEHMVSEIISNQMCNGFGFDVDRAIDLEQELLYEKAQIEDDMRTVFPDIVEERYSEKTGKRLKDKVTVFNPSSRQQIAERLSDKYGWKYPLTDKGNPKVDADVVKNLEYPEAKELTKYFDIIKTMSFLKDWITRALHSRDGRIHSGVNPQGTVTGRMTSSQPNLQQVTSDRRVRELFVPKKGWKQVGIDASGLEARMLANRMYPWDSGEYGKVVVEGDIHQTNMEATGIDSRADVKTFFYGFIYGAGDAKVGKIIGKDSRAGKELKEKFLSNLPALRKLIESCKFQSLKKKTVTLLDGREAPCRSEHSSLNVQLQGDGAIVMKLAQCIFADKIVKQYKDRALFMATVHDEWQLECEPEIAEEIGKLGVDSIKEAGERLGCLISMDGEYKIGDNWWDCH
tara:strand:- start:10831 stop:12531 length:1701 start_codon:yes stop_codon:yes gene_type:complete